MRAGLVRTGCRRGPLRPRAWPLFRQTPRDRAGPWSSLGMAPLVMAHATERGTRSGAIVSGASGAANVSIRICTCCWARHPGPIALWLCRLRTRPIAWAGAPREYRWCSGTRVGTGFESHGVFVRRDGDHAGRCGIDEVLEVDIERAGASAKGGRSLHNVCRRCRTPRHGANRPWSKGSACGVG